MTTSSIIDHSPLTRRTFLKSAAAGATLAAFSGSKAFAADAPKGKTVLLRSGWQTANIGDIAHTPGMLHQLDVSLPDVNVILWKSNVLDRGVEKLLREGFPKLKIVDTEDGPTLEEAFAQADLLLHGSGPSIHPEIMQKWSNATHKPYGAIGNTFSTSTPREESRVTLSNASFLFTRETHSLENLKKANVTCPIMDFAPDATFAFHLQDEPAAKEFLAQNGLEEGKFICVVPRLRVTPYYKIYPDRNDWPEKRRQEVDALNAKWAEPDHAKAREAMVRWVRETGNKVLVCPEMTYQLDIMDELLINPLPDDVKKSVVKRGTYWLPNEAASVYRRANCVLSYECHSPIIALAMGTPAFYLRQPQDTIKGQMYYDLGASNWVFEIEETEGQQIADRLMEVAGNESAAKEQVERIMQQAATRLANAMQAVKQTLDHSKV